MLVSGDGFDPSNGCVSHGQHRPRGAGELLAGGKGHEEIVPLCVAGGGQRNGTDRPRLECVRRRVVFEQLHVCAKFEAHMVVVGHRSAGDDAVGAHGGRNAVRPRELVEAAHSIGHHMRDHKPWETFERKTVCARAQAFFDGAYGALDLADVAVGGNNVECNRQEGGSRALELVVTVHVANDEASRCVAIDGGSEFLQYGGLRTVGYWVRGAETDAA